MACVGSATGPSAAFTLCTLDMGGLGRHFDVQSSTLTLSYVALINGVASATAPDPVPPPPPSPPGPATGSFNGAGTTPESNWAWQLSSWRTNGCASPVQFRNRCGDTIYDGGAIAADQWSSLLISNSLFSNNVVSNSAMTVHGGAISFRGVGTTFSVDRSTFIGNSATFTGGAIKLTCSQMTASVSNSLFVGNSASLGGAIMSLPSTGALLSVSGCNFTSNVATGKTENVRTGVVSNFVQSNFLTNGFPKTVEREGQNPEGGFGGGAIAADWLSVDSSSFTGNQACLACVSGPQNTGYASYGGAIQMMAGVYEVGYSSWFPLRSSELSCGFSYTSYDSDLQQMVTTCSNYNFGSATYSQCHNSSLNVCNIMPAKPVTITNSVFTGNYASGSGGAIFSSFHNVEPTIIGGVTDKTYVCANSHKTPTLTYPVGFNASAMWGVLTLSNVTFTGNSAGGLLGDFNSDGAGTSGVTKTDSSFVAGGGAVVLSAGHLIATAVSCVGNTVYTTGSSPSEGGCFWLLSTPSASVFNSSFSGNSAGTGGAVSLACYTASHCGDTATIAQSSFTANSATSNGGAVSSSWSASTTMLGC